MCGGVYEEDMMVEDAQLMSRFQFIELYGAKHESIWREYNPNMGDIKFMTAGDFMNEPDDGYCTPGSDAQV